MLEIGSNLNGTKKVVCVGSLGKITVVELYEQWLFVSFQHINLQLTVKDWTL